jgi:hypothetical protein
MPIIEDFTFAIARYFSVPHDQITIRADGMTVAGIDMPVPGSFDLFATLNNARVQASSAYTATIDSGTRTVAVGRAELRPQVESGIIELSTRDCWFFLGTFGTSVSNVNLDICPEMILAIACLPPIMPMGGQRDWSSVLESWGPLIVSTSAPSEPELAEFGCFLAGTPSKLPEFLPASQSRPFLPRPAAVPEALNAYVFAHKASDGPDVVFLRFYRIFELQFAATIQSEITRAPLGKVYETLRTLHSASELDVLRRTFDMSNVAFDRFTRTDFHELFGQPFQPVRDQYRPISNWLTSGNALPMNCRAPLVYFVRCALVHSKITEAEKFLFGPFESARANALDHLASDMRDVLRDLLAL